jgi:predicted lipid carrier protein YhbT
MRLGSGMRLPDFTVPLPLARWIGFLPSAPLAWALTLGLNLARGRLFAADALHPLEGKRVAFRALDVAQCVTLTLGPSGFAAAPASSEPADLTISASVHDLMALALRQEDSDSLFFDRRLVLEGDTELGLLVKNTFDSVDFAALEIRVFGHLLPIRPRGK